jgi:hypothetical protein
MNEHERGLLAFLAEPTKRRMEKLLELGKKRRGDVRDLLDHSVRLDPRFCEAITGSDAFPPCRSDAPKEGRTADLLRFWPLTAIWTGARCRSAKLWTRS